MKIQVCIATDALLANVIPALTERPDLVYLVTTDEMRTHADDLVSLLNAEKIPSRIWRDPSDGRWPGTSDTAGGLSEHVRVTYPDAEVTVNVTGGLKPMAFGFVLGFRGIPHRTIYVDMRHGVINTLELPPPADQPIPDILDVRRYLLASGFQINGIQSHDPRWKRDAVEVRELTEYLAANWSTFGDLADLLNAAAADARDSYERRGVAWSQPVRVAVSPSLALSHSQMIENLVGHRVVGWSKTKPGVMEMLDYSRARYLGGFWLEEYVYLALSTLGLTDLAVGVSGTWRTGGKAQGENEFDVVATYRNRLLFVECKAGVFRADQKIQETFGKIDAIGNRAAGRFGSVMLVSPRTLKPAAVVRAQAGRIFPLHGTGVTRVRDVVERWMSSGRLERPGR